MAARAYVDVFCDECGGWSHGESTNKRIARAKVRKNGFVYVLLNGVMVDLCPRCALENGFEISDDAAIEVNSFAIGSYMITGKEFKARHMNTEGE